MDPNLLRECAQRLLETADFIRGTNRTTAVTSTTQTTTTTSSSAPVMQQTLQTLPNSATNRDTVRSEHTRLFGYRPPAPSRAPRNPRANSREVRRPPYTNAAIGRASSTWSRSFVCMATAGQQTPPSTSERIDLSLNGLGEKKLSFPKEGNSAEVHGNILAAFPVLGEGYEILRAGEGNLALASKRGRLDVDEDSPKIPSVRQYSSFSISFRTQTRFVWAHHGKFCIT